MKQVDYSHIIIACLLIAIEKVFINCSVALYEVRIIDHYALKQSIKI